jgi:hypothetical protein
MQEMIAAGTLGGSTAEQRISLASAQLALALGLNLPADGDFSHYDPLADASAAGLAAQKAATQVATLAQLASSDPSKQQALIRALASDLANDTSATGLADATRIAAALSAAGFGGVDSNTLASALGRLAAATSLEALSQAQSSELGLAIAGAVSLKSLKHGGHIAALVGLLGFLGTAKSLAKVPALLSGETVERAAAVGVQAAFAVLSLIFVALCVKSFIDARRARTSNPS